MTLDEVRSNYQSLAEIMTEAGLGWVVDQVERAIRGGRPAEKPTKIFKEEDWEEGALGLFGDQLRPGAPESRQR